MLTVLASTNKDLDFGTLRILTPQSAVHADGAMYHSDEPAAFMFQTADCPFLVVQDDVTGKVAMGHCGKYAMKPCHDGEVGCGDMVSTVLSHFKDVDPINLSAYITAGICGKCYKHEQDVSKVSSFYHPNDNFGEDQACGELHLIRRIKHGLRFHGIPEVNIKIDGRCTRNTPGLSSYRQGDPHRNTIVVSMN
jgi:copper oxidase (laccase) domain-containing protein